jgi:DNA helicase-2/ATP-dependent DNA helicase PcrA
MTAVAKAGAPSLDEDQRRVAEAGVEERLYVTAGPGSGKTETVSARIEYLLDEEDLSGEDILVISFSRAAVEAVQRRQRQNGSRSWVWVTTIDSLTARVLSDEGLDITGLGFDARINKLTGILAEDGIEDLLPDVRHVIIDEVQDVVGIRANLVTHLLAALPDDVGFTMLGDPKQAIYDFQLDDGFSDPHFLLRSARGLRATEVGLWGQYRAESRDAAKAMKLRGVGRTDLAWIGEMEEFVADMPVFDADGLAGQLQQMQGSVAVLTQSNAQALTAARDLYVQGIQAEVLARSADRSIDPWVARVLGDAPTSLTKEQFQEIAASNTPLDWEEAWALLRRMTKANTKYLTLVEVAQRFSNGIVPVALTRRRGQLTVSTVHRAKGLEFDHVLLLNTEDWYGDRDSGFGRTLYVAITRPRRRLVSFRRRPTDLFWKTCDRTERAYKTNHKGKGTTGFEIRGTDWRGITPPGNDEDPVTAQTLLKELAAVNRPTPVEIRLNAYGSTLSRPRYDAYLHDVCIGTLGEGFIEAFIRRLGRIGDNWPDIAGTFFTGVETVAGPPQAGPLGHNGLWLSPLILGPAALDWRRS